MSTTLTNPRPGVPFSTWIAATRPGFLIVTFVTAVLGVAAAAAGGVALRWPQAVATVLLALLAHAAINLYNDWGDARLGSDALNEGRLTPFSGGSRFIQDGVLTAEQVHAAAQVLAGVVIGGGILLVATSGAGLLLVGMAGLAIGFAYSHPRIALMSRGVGEFGVVAGWWLVVVGADYVQRRAFGPATMVMALAPALLIGAVLLVAEFPDAAADGAVGKRTWVVRGGATGAALVAWAMTLGAHAWTLLWWWLDWLPGTAGWALGSLPLTLAADVALWRHRHAPARLRGAIKLTIAAAVAHAALLAGACAASGF